MAPRAKRAPRSVAAAVASVSKKAKAATSKARVVFADGEKVPELPPVPSPSPVDTIVRERLEREHGTDVLNRHIAEQIAQVASISSRAPEMPYPFSAGGPNSPVGAVNFLRDSAIEKDFPGPDPRKARVITTTNGLYRLPSPTSLPTGARVTVPFTARALVGNSRQFVVDVQGPGFTPAWRPY